MTERQTEKLETRIDREDGYKNNRTLQKLSTKSWTLKQTERHIYRHEQTDYRKIYKKIFLMIGGLTNDVAQLRREIFSKIPSSLITDQYTVYTIHGIQKYLFSLSIYIRVYIYIYTRIYIYYI